MPTYYLARKISLLQQFGVQSVCQIGFIKEMRTVSYVHPTNQNNISSFLGRTLLIIETISLKKQHMKQIIGRKLFKCLNLQVNTALIKTDWNISNGPLRIRPFVRMSNISQETRDHISSLLIEYIFIHEHIFMLYEIICLHENLQTPGFARLLAITVFGLHRIPDFFYHNTVLLFWSQLSKN